MKLNLRKFFVPLIGPAGLIILWQIVGASPQGVIQFLPTPLSTFESAVKMATDGSIFADISATVSRWGIGFALALAIGIPIGLLIGASPFLSRACGPTIDFFRSLPATAVFPVFLLALGVGNAAMIGMVFFATVFIVVLHAVSGVKSSPKARVMMAKSLGASSFQIFFYIQAIEAIGHVVVGVRTALSLSLIVAVVSEMFIGTANGLGQRIYLSYQLQNLSVLFASIITIGFLGFFANIILKSLEERFVAWSQ